MIFGIVSPLDDTTTYELFRSKRVTKENILHINFISNLVNTLNSGDTVYVVNVNRFFSVAQFLGFGKICMQKGVSLRVIAQPYLDLGNGKQWKPSVMNQMASMVEVERRAIRSMAQSFKYTDEYWNFMCRRFEIMNLEVLAHTFSADGLLKRGS